MYIEELLTIIVSDFNTYRNRLLPTKSRVQYQLVPYTKINNAKVKLNATYKR